MCDQCIKIFDDELLRDTTRLRQKLVKGEKNVVKFMDRIVKWLEAEKDWSKHTCKTSRLRVLGVAKAKKLGLYTEEAKKSKKLSVRRVKKLTSPKSNNFQAPVLTSTESQAPVLTPIESLQSVIPIQDEKSEERYQFF